MAIVFEARILTITLFLICSGIPFGDAQTPSKPGREFTIDVPQSKVDFFVGSSAGDVDGTFRSGKGEFKVASPAHSRERDAGPGDLSRQPDNG